MELPEELVRRHKQQLEKENKLFKKHKATVEYRRRKLDKDVRKHIKESRRVIRGSDIEAIGRRHKSFIEGTQ